MAHITVDIEPANDLAVFTLTGSLASGELLQRFIDYNQGDVRRLMLFDFTDANWSSLTSKQLRNNTAIASKYTSSGNRGAFVFSNDADYGIGRMVQAFASMENHLSEFRMFRSIEEARQWLMSEAVPSDAV